LAGIFFLRNKRVTLENGKMGQGDSKFSFQGLTLPPSLGCTFGYQKQHRKGKDSPESYAFYHFIHAIQK
jgi:hypothetical protein